MSIEWIRLDYFQTVDGQRQNQIPIDKRTKIVRFWFSRKSLRRTESFVVGGPACGCRTARIIFDELERVLCPFENSIRRKILGLAQKPSGFGKKHKHTNTAYQSQFCYVSRYGRNCYTARWSSGSESEAVCIRTIDLPWLKPSTAPRSGRYYTATAEANRLGVSQSSRKPRNVQQTLYIFHIIVYQNHGNRRVHRTMQRSCFYVEGEGERSRLMHGFPSNPTCFSLFLFFSFCGIRNVFPNIRVFLQ